MQNGEGVIGCSRQITPSEICISLQAIRKPNSITVLSFILSEQEKNFLIQLSFRQALHQIWLSKTQEFLSKRLCSNDLLLIHLTLCQHPRLFLFSAALKEKLTMKTVIFVFFCDSATIHLNFEPGNELRLNRSNSTAI